MSAHTGFGPRDRWRLRQNRLWILAAILGAATLWSYAGIVHDTAPRHVAASLVRQATAERIGSYAESRLTILGLEAFASTPRRDVLPAGELFSFDRRSTTLERKMRGSVPDAAVIAAARQVRAGVHLTTSRALGDAAIVTYVAPDTTIVLGVIVPAREIGAVLFANADRATEIVDPGERMVTLDSMAMLVFGADSIALFGRPDPAGRYYAPSPLHGSLEGSTLALALPTSRINGALLQFGSWQQMLHNGMLTLATIIVVIFAVGSSRREMLLARSRSDFVAGVSHDLRMPLAQILLAGETLTTHPDAPKRERESLGNTIVRESRRLIGMVENLLLFSRTGSTDLHPQLATVRVDELFASVVEAVELAAEDANQTIDASATNALAVLADARLLRQALVNLVDNAIKYGPTGQCIRLRSESASGATVHLTVDDSGPGIPPRERERVFQPYHRLDRDQTSERTGTGLGLAVVRQIVQACGGRVWIESGPGAHGARVVIELAAVSAERPVEAPAVAT